MNLVFGTAVFVFGVVNEIFGFLAWLFPEADDDYRTNLDNLFVLLDELSLFEIGHRSTAPTRNFD